MKIKEVSAFKHKFADIANLPRNAIEFSLPQST